MTGYKQMISDNIPLTWNMALLWCHCKIRWINYVYDNHIRKYKDKKKKSKTVKEIMGKSKDSLGVTHTFSDSIDWGNLYMNDKKQYNYWVIVEKWIVWFTSKGVFLEEHVKFMENRQYSFEEAVKDLNDKFRINNIKLSTFILNHYKYGRK